MRLTVWQAAALLYLLLPLAIFLLFFSNGLMAAAGLIFIGWSVWRLMRDGVEQSLSMPMACGLLLVSCFMIALSGILPPLGQDFDYRKHYGILKLLIDHPWPVVIDNGEAPVMLRYYLGWYLVPAGLCKLFGPALLDSVLAVWSALGLWLIFALLAESLKIKNRWLAILAAPMFMFFSGADLAGTALTKLYSSVPLYHDHYEYWALFYQYQAVMTTFMGSLQHGLPAWIAIGLLLSAGPSSRLLSHAGLFFFAILFWSPLCALGTAPFILVSSATGTKSLKQLFSASNFLSAAALGLPIMGYLFSGTQEIPHGWIFDTPGWTMNNLIMFWILEFGLFAVLAMMIGTERSAMLYTAALVLLLAPFVRTGIANDFPMRVSIPALAVLAWIVIEIILTRPLLKTLPLIMVFMLGVNTAYMGIARGFRHDFRADAPDRIMLMTPENKYRAQYIAPYPSPFVR
ncbi:MAG: hypothetical protein WDO70_07360 [Alphaproteobacteria bacterium]